MSEQFNYGIPESNKPKNKGGNNEMNTPSAVIKARQLLGEFIDAAA